MPENLDTRMTSNTYTKQFLSTPYAPLNPTSFSVLSVRSSPHAAGFSTSTLFAYCVFATV